MKIYFPISAFIVLSFSSFCQPSLHSVASFASSNLPIVVINTHGVAIVDEPKITANMGIIDNGEGKRNSLSDPFNNYNGKIAIEIRGSSSQMFDKKQYGFTTVDSSGGDYDVPLLGFPTEHTWMLSAQYNDKTLMRDALTFLLSSQIGHYASRTKYCEVFLNGDYKGVYLLMEKIKRDKNRVNISKMTAADTAGDNLTGGYIYKIDKADKPTDKGWDALYPPFASSARRYLMYQYEYPDPEEIMPAQIKYLQTFEKHFEVVMNSPFYKDTALGYPKILDVPSFVDMTVINELSKNVDGYRLSTFLYKDRTSKNEKLFAGPLWDYNLGYGNANYGDAFLRTGWQVENESSSSVSDPYAPPFWWKILWGDTGFKKLTALRWKVLRAHQMSTANIFTIIDSLAMVVNEGQQRNFERWPIIGTYVWPNYYYTASSYADEVNYLKGWFISRMDWMDRTLAPLSTAVHEVRALEPSTTALEQNYPNPCNPSTAIRYSLNSIQHVTISIYDVLGRLTSSLVNDVQPAGAYCVVWNASRTPSGVYFCRMNAGPNASSIRIAVIQ